MDHELVFIAGLGGMDLFFSRKTYTSEARKQAASDYYRQGE